MTWKGLHDRRFLGRGTLQIALNRFPLKHAWDALALAQIMVRGDLQYQRPLSFGKRLECLRFYFTAEGIDRLYVAPSRAGTIWTRLGLELALDLAGGGDGEYVSEGEFFPRRGLSHRYFDWRVPTGVLDEICRRSDGPAFGEQLFFHARLPYSRVRSARLKKMRIVLVTRSILASLESRFFKFAALSGHPEVILEDENTFEWDRFLTNHMDFFNSWGDVMGWHPNIRHFKFEDLKADPVGTHKEILDFWGFDVPEDCVAEGFRRVSKKEMLKRMPADERARNVRISTRGAERRGIISEARRRHIVDRLKRELIFDFGYDYENDAGYGVAYD